MLGARTILIATCLVAAASQFGHAQQRPSERRSWMDYGGQPDNSKYMTLDQITKQNVHQLEVAWTYPSQDSVSYVFNPVIVDNVMYVFARNRSLVAIDATSGKELWVHEGLDGMAARGINYWESKDRKDRRLLFQMNSYLQAIDARTGKSILTFGTNGVVNLREGLDRDVSQIIQTQSQNPGKVFENLIILGSAPGEQYISPPGDLRAYNVITGKLVWTFHTIPRPGEFGHETWPADAYKYLGAANTWGELTVDPVHAIAYFPLGSPTYDFYGADRHGTNLFGNCLVALDARTGKRLWHFQAVHHDLWDYDNVAAPILTTIRKDGRMIDVVALAGKTGFLYVFDRVTGQPVWPIEERTVPPSEIPGERAWPTQPFPTAPPPFAKQSFTTTDLNPYILTPEQRAEWKSRLSKSRGGGIFNPPTTTDTVIMPGTQGGANWGTTSSNPTNGTVYVLGINIPSVLKVALEPPQRGGGFPNQASAAAIERGTAVYKERCESCHGPDRAGSGGVPGLEGVTLRMGPTALRETILGGRASMPPMDDLSPADLGAVIAFLATPVEAGSAGGRGGGPPAPPSLGGPVVDRGGAPAGRDVPKLQPQYMVGPAYPTGVVGADLRYYSGYNTNALIASPPYSTITAYDLNTGTIKWQVPSGGEDARAVLEGGKDTGFMQNRTGVITTSTGLLFQAGGDAKLRAYDADTGKLLWTTGLPAGSRGLSSMYEVNGRQYLVINATLPITAATGPTSGGKPGYVAFALPASATAR